MQYVVDFIGLIQKEVYGIFMYKMNIFRMDRIFFYTNTVHGGMVWLTKEIFFKIFRKWDSEYYLNFEP